MIVFPAIDLKDGACVRLRRGGSSGGHRGIESILQAVGGADFLRVKIGIGRPPGREN